MNTNKDCNTQLQKLFLKYVMLCQRNIKRAKHIVELYKHAAIFKNMSVLKNSCMLI